MSEAIDETTGEIVDEETTDAITVAGLSANQIAALRAPLSRAHVKTRQQAGRALSYIEGWHAIKEANRIFGFDGWTRETVEMRLLGESQITIGRDQNTRPGWTVWYLARCRVRVRAGTDWLLREGTGYGSGIDASLGAAHESAAKEAETDAMKRALMTFGNPFGLALYDRAQADVVVEAPAKPAQRGKPAKAKDDTQGETPPPAASAGDAGPISEQEEKAMRGRVAANALREFIDQCQTAAELDAAMESEVARETTRILRETVGEAIALDTLSKMRNRIENHRILLRNASVSAPKTADYATRYEV